MAAHPSGPLESFWHTRPCVPEKDHQIIMIYYGSILFFNNTKDRFDAVLNAKTTSVCKLITTSKRVKEFCLETPLEECRFKKNVN